MDVGIKNDADKPMFDLLDPDALEEVARVLTFGARKYAPDNWRKGMSVRKCIAGVLRHVFAILRGEYRDPETGLLHSAHAICGLMFVTHYLLKGIEKPDDRFAQTRLTQVVAAPPEPAELMCLAGCEVLGCNGNCAKPRHLPTKAHLCAKHNEPKR